MNSSLLSLPCLALPCLLPVLPCPQLMSFAAFIDVGCCYYFILFSLHIQHSLPTLRAIIQLLHYSIILLFYYSPTLIALIHFQLTLLLSRYIEAKNYIIPANTACCSPSLPRRSLCSLARYWLVPPRSLSSRAHCLTSLQPFLWNEEPICLLAFAAIS